MFATKYIITPNNSLCKWKGKDNKRKRKDMQIKLLNCTTAQIIRIFFLFKQEILLRTTW